MSDSCKMFDNCKKGVASRNIYHENHGQQAEYVDQVCAQFPCNNKGGMRYRKSKMVRKTRNTKKSRRFRKTRKSKKSRRT